MLPYFDRLGAAVERGWSAEARRLEAFADVAAQALREHPAAPALDERPDSLGLAALIDAALEPERAVPEPLAHPGAFGQPGLTAYRGADFVVEVYFWSHSRSAIHDHPFQGAFTVVSGFSVHATYDVQIEQELGPRARLGVIGLRDLRLLEAGHVEPFGARHPLVHALLHVPMPSVSLVVRTIRADDYFRYFPPGVALAMSPPAHGVERALMLLDTLRRAGDPSYASRRDTFLRGADFETTYRTLSRLLPVAGGDERAHLLALATERFGDAAARVEPSLTRAFDAQEAESMRASLTDPTERLIAVGLELAESRAQLLSLLEPRLSEPVASLRAFVDHPERFTDDEFASRLLARALVDGVDLTSARSRLVAQFDEAAVAAQEAAIRRYWTRSPFACLGV